MTPMMIQTIPFQQACRAQTGKPPVFQGGLPRYAPDVDIYTGRKRHVHNDYLMTAPDGDRYPQFEMFPFPYRMDEDRLERFLDTWV